MDNSIICTLMAHMIFLQEKINVKSECVLNSFYLMSEINKFLIHVGLEPSAKLQTVVICGNRQEATGYVSHVVVMYNNERYDSSYETYLLTNKTYYTDLKMIKSLKNGLLKKLEKNYKGLLKCTDDINKGLSPIIKNLRPESKHYYYGLCNYMNEHIKYSN